MPDTSCTGSPHNATSITVIAKKFVLLNVETVSLRLSSPNLRAFCNRASPILATLRTVRNLGY